MFLKKMFIGIGLTVLLVLAGCSSQDKNGNTEMGETTKKEVTAPNNNGKKYKLRVGYGNVYGAPLADLAIDQGFFEEENLEIEMVGFAGEGLTALQSGKIDVALTFGSTYPMSFIANGADFRMIGGHMEGGHPIVTKKENVDQYKTLQDFKGKKIASTPMGTLDAYFKAALTEAGIDIEKDVQFIETDSVSTTLQAVKTGKADVGLSATAHLEKSRRLGLEPILWLNDINKNAVCCRVTVRGNISEEEAIAYKKFMKGLIKAERVKLEAPEKNLEASLDRFKNLEKDLVNEIVNEPHLINTADPNKKETLELWEKMKKLGYVKEDSQNIDMNAYFNLTFYEQALQELIKENPNDEYYKKVWDRYIKQNS